MGTNFQFKCEMCEKYFTSRGSLKDHYLNNHIHLVYSYTEGYEEMQTLNGNLKRTKTRCPQKQTEQVDFSSTQ